MRLAVAPVLIVMILGREASAQVGAAPPSQVAPLQTAVAAQVAFDTSYLLARYMTELALAGTAPTQADIDEAARQYFTNGAAATSVPAHGPGAAFFRSGAEIMAYPAPMTSPAPEAVVQPEAGPTRSEAREGEEDAGGPPDASGPEDDSGAGVLRAGAALPPEVTAVPTTAEGPHCEPFEIEAAMAIASQFASAEAPSPVAVSCPPSTASPPAPSDGEVAPAAVRKRVAGCPPRPIFYSVGPALGGAFLGGLAVALWSRPRSLRGAQRR